MDSNNETKSVRVVLTLTGGAVVKSDPVRLHERPEDGPTVDQLVKDNRTFTTFDTFAMSVNGARVWFNPAHIVAVQLVNGAA
jgi:hypothetical protein